MRRLLALGILLLLPVTATGYECEYRRVSLKDRKVTVTLPPPVGATTAIVEKGITGVVQFMEFEKGQWRYSISWDGALVLNRIHAPDGKHFDYYFPSAAIMENDVLKSDTAEPSMTCRE